MHVTPSESGEAGPSSARRARRGGVLGIVQLLGPGLITGASDDDPSGIGTYSQVGAQFGYGMLWTALFTFPLMAAIQELCAHIALQTGVGLGVAPRRVQGFVIAVVAVLGTTISPYLFFWQASAEVDEMRAAGLRSEADRRGVKLSELRAARIDVLIGMGFSQVVMYAIILTSAAVLHAHGKAGVQAAD